jgi:hypothetical protein
MTTVHACPPEDEGLTRCCGVAPFELPLTDRMTLDPALVTCGVMPDEYDGPVYVGDEQDEPELVDEETADDDFR